MLFSVKIMFDTKIIGSKQDKWGKFIVATCKKTMSGEKTNWAIWLFVWNLKLIESNLPDDF